MPEWLEFLLADTSALQLVFWIVAIGFLIAAIVKLWPVLRQLVTIVDAVTGLPEFITRTDQAIAEIHHETHNNDGSSIKDSVDRIENGVAGLHLKVEELAASDEQLRAADEALRGELENTRPNPPKES